jgi:peptidoglycan/LPS O-acetylase OafA/YrhL
VEQAKQGYIPSLDGWRAIAIGAVLVSHSFPSTYWTQHGALGVNLFFAISGFLITTRLLDDPSLKRFYIRRAFRILPPALFFLAVASAAVPSPRTDLLSSLFFLRNYWGADPQHGWYTAHFWSLAVEEHFYLIWPAVLILAGIRRARFVAPALALAVAAWRSLDLRHAWLATLLHSEHLRNSPLRTDYRMDALFWGCTLALAPRFKGHAAAAALPLAAAIALDIYQPQGYMALQAILFPCILALTVARPATFLEWPPLRWIGRLSYSLYLWQQLFFSHYHHGFLQRFPLNLACALACAGFSYYLIEKPMVRLGHRLAHPQYDRKEPDDARRIGTRISTPPRTGCCRPELSLTQPESGVN